MGGLVKVDLGHGRGWAAPTAAASIRRIDRDLGRPADINEAGRSPEKADKNYRKWLAYKNGTGPWAPYALPASKSVHCWGNAADSDDWYNPAAAAVWRDHGWRQTARYNDDRDEPWHGEHFPNLDNHRNDPAPAGEATDPAPAPEPEPEEDDMPKNTGLLYRAPMEAPKEKQREYLLIMNTGSGYQGEISSGLGGEIEPDRRREFANAFDTTSIIRVNEDEAKAFKAGLPPLRTTA